jgi:hypothetical protein
MKSIVKMPSSHTPDPSLVRCSIIGTPLFINPENNTLQRLALVNPSNGVNSGNVLMSASPIPPEPGNGSTDYPEEQFLVTMSISVATSRVNAYGKPIAGNILKLLDVVTTVSVPSKTLRKYPVDILIQNSGANVPVFSSATLTTFVSDGIMFATFVGKIQTTP